MDRIWLFVRTHIRMILRIIGIVGVILLILWAKSCVFPTVSNDKSSVKSDSTTASPKVALVAPSMIDTQLSGLVDQKFAANLKIATPDRAKKFGWWVVICFFLLVTYSLLRGLKWKTWSYAPITILGALFGLAVFHWLLWSLSPLWWENFYQSKTFWPINLAIFVISGNVAGKRYGKVTAGILVLAAVMLVIAIWPSSQKSYLRNLVTGTSSTIKTSAWNWESVTCVEDTAVRKAFPRDTTMWKIARAESDCMQFKSNGTLAKNPESSAVGIFQILEGAHGRDCGISGVDIHTIEGNIACARKLSLLNPNYSPWDDSAGKWRDGIQVDTVAIPTASPVIVTAIEQIKVAIPTASPVIVTTVEQVKIDTTFLTASADQEWSEMVNTDGKPFVISLIGHRKISIQACESETDCGQIYPFWKDQTVIPRAIYIRARSDSSETTIIQVEVGKKM
jgi:hypothetical protein